MERRHSCQSCSCPVPVSNGAPYSGGCEIIGTTEVKGIWHQGEPVDVSGATVEVVIGSIPDPEP